MASPMIKKTICVPFPDKSVHTYLASTSWFLGHTVKLDREPFGKELTLEWGRERAMPANHESVTCSEASGFPEKRKGGLAASNPVNAPSHRPVTSPFLS